jgi:hypothetical protein
LVNWIPSTPSCNGQASKRVSASWVERASCNPCGQCQVAYRSEVPNVLQSQFSHSSSAFPVFPGLGSIKLLSFRLYKALPERNLLKFGWWSPSQNSWLFEKIRSAMCWLLLKTKRKDWSGWTHMKVITIPEVKFSGFSFS